MLFNIRTQHWDEQLLELFNIPRAILPIVKDNVADFGQTSKDIVGGIETNVTVGLNWLPKERWRFSANLIKASMHSN